MRVKGARRAKMKKNAQMARAEGARRIFWGVGLGGPSIDACIKKLLGVCKKKLADAEYLFG